MCPAVSFYFWPWGQYTITTHRCTVHVELARYIPYIYIVINNIHLYCLSSYQVFFLFEISFWMSAIFGYLLYIFQASRILYSVLKLNLCLALYKKHHYSIQEFYLIFFKKYPIWASDSIQVWDFRLFCIWVCGSNWRNASVPLSPTANRNKIREAHRKLMILNHPDRGERRI